MLEIPAPLRRGERTRAADPVAEGAGSSRPSPPLPLEGIRPLSLTTEVKLYFVKLQNMRLFDNPDPYFS